MAASSGSNWLISSSIWALITTVPAPCAAAISCTCCEKVFPVPAVSSSTLHTNRIGLLVKSCSIFQAFRSSSSTSTLRAGFPSSSTTKAALSKRSCCTASLSPPRTLRLRPCRRFSMLSISASISSVSIVSASDTGSTRPSTWVTSESSKQRST